MALKNNRAAPVTREGWSNYYGNRFNRFGHPDALHLSIWYQLLYLAFGERE